MAFPAHMARACRQQQQQPQQVEGEELNPTAQSTAPPHPRNAEILIWVRPPPRAEAVVFCSWSAPRRRVEGGRGSTKTTLGVPPTTPSTGCGRARRRSPIEIGTAARGARRGDPSRASCERHARRRARAAHGHARRQDARPTRIRASRSDPPTIVVIAEYKEPAPATLPERGITLFTVHVRRGDARRARPGSSTRTRSSTTSRRASRPTRPVPTRR